MLGASSQRLAQTPATSVSTWSRSPMRHHSICKRAHMPRDHPHHSNLAPGAQSISPATSLNFVDQVALTVSEDRQSGVMLLLRSVFGMQSQEGHDLVDANGLMRPRLYSRRPARRYAAC